MFILTPQQWNSPRESWTLIRNHYSKGPRIIQADSHLRRNKCPRKWRFGSWPLFNYSQFTLVFDLLVSLLFFYTQNSYHQNGQTTRKLRRNDNCETTHARNRCWLRDKGWLCLHESIAVGRDWKQKTQLNRTKLGSQASTDSSKKKNNSKNVYTLWENHPNARNFKQNQQCVTRRKRIRKKQQLKGVFNFLFFFCSLGVIEFAFFQ